MKFFELNKSEKLYFGHEEIARILGISLQSAKVTANRYVKKGILIRINEKILYREPV